MQKISKLIILVLMAFLVFGISIVPAYGEKADIPQAEKNAPLQEPAPKYIKHVVIIALDGFENKYFTDVITPRLLGISKEGINGKVIDKSLQPDIKSQDQVLIGTLAADYRKTQRKSVLINGRTVKQHLDYGFNTVLNIGSEDLDNPKKIVQEAVSHFQKEQPYLTYLTFGSESSKGNEQINHFKTVDEAVGDFVGMLHQQDLYEYTLFVVVGRKSAQVNSLPNQKIKSEQIEFPLGIRGPNLNAGYKIPPVNYLDLPATIFYLTDGKEISSRGNVLWNIIKADNFYGVQELLRERIRDISKERDELIIQEINWERERLNLANQQNILAQERQGIQNEITSRDQTIKTQGTRLALYRLFGFILTCTFLFGYAVQYYLLRKRFLLF